MVMCKARPPGDLSPPHKDPGIFPTAFPFGPHPEPPIPRVPTS